MNKKMPNNVVSEVEGDEEEVNPNQFQDDVLSCLRELQHLAETMKEKANDMEHTIKRFKISIHGEDIDG
jgi:cell division septum initiation protein DivIVA